MKNQNMESKSIIDMLKDEDTLKKALRLARRAAVRQHKFANVPLSFWKDGRIIEVPPEEFELNDVNAKSE